MCLVQAFYYRTRLITWFWIWFCWCSSLDLRHSGSSTVRRWSLLCVNAHWLDISFVHSFKLHMLTESLLPSAGQLLKCLAPEIPTFYIFIMKETLVIMRHSKTFVSWYFYWQHSPYWIKVSNMFDVIKKADFTFFSSRFFFLFWAGSNRVLMILCVLQGVRGTCASTPCRPACLCSSCCHALRWLFTTCCCKPSSWGWSSCLTLCCSASTPLSSCSDSSLRLYSSGDWPLTYPAGSSHHLFILLF